MADNCCCKTCGLLACEEPETRKTIEVAANWRKLGFYQGPTFRPSPLQVFCLVGSPCHKGQLLFESSDDALKAMDSGKGCTEWIQWRRGTSPSDHELLATRLNPRLELAIVSLIQRELDAVVGKLTVDALPTAPRLIEAHGQPGKP